MIFFAAVCILGGFLHAMTGKRPPLHLESNTMLCMAYMSALVAVKSTKTCTGYVRRGKGSLSFYEGSGDANHPGYCSPLCGSVMGPYSDPFDGWSADQQ